VAKATVVVKVSVVGFQLDGARKILDRIRVIHFAVMRDTAVVKCIGVVRVNGERRGVVLDGQVKELELVVCKSTVEERLEVRPVELDRLRILFDRRTEIAPLPMRKPLCMMPVRL
jgi:hypothetical protein